MTRSDEMSHRDRLGIEGPQDRPAEGVADDRHRLHSFPLDRVEQFDGIEMAAGQGDD